MGNEEHGGGCLDATWILKFSYVTRHKLWGLRSVKSLLPFHTVHHTLFLKNLRLQMKC